MTTPATHDFTVVVGTTDPFVFRLKASDGNGGFVPIPLTDLVLTIKCGGDAAFSKSLEAGDFVNTDPATGEYTWTPTPTDTRKFKVGAEADGKGKNKYELETRNGTSEMVYLVGTIIGIGGLNTDA